MGKNVDFKGWNSQTVWKDEASTVNTSQDKNKNRQPVRKMAVA